MMRQPIAPYVCDGDWVWIFYGPDARFSQLDVKSFYDGDNCKFVRKSLPRQANKRLPENFVVNDGIQQRVNRVFEEVLRRIKSSLERIGFMGKIHYVVAGRGVDYNIYQRNAMIHCGMHFIPVDDTRDAAELELIKEMEQWIEGSGPNRVCHIISKDHLFRPPMETLMREGDNNRVLATCNRPDRDAFVGRAHLVWDWERVRVARNIGPRFCLHPI